MGSGLEKKRPGFKNKGTFKKGITPWNKGKELSEESKLKMSEAHTGMSKPWMHGANNPKWNGGTTKLRRRVERSIPYKTWRKAIFERDSYTCRWCGQKGGKIEVDHIVPYSYLIEKNQIRTLDKAIKCKELWDLNNGRTLCRACHKKTDTYAKKPQLINLKLLHG